MSYVLYSFLLFSAVLVNGKTASKTDLENDICYYLSRKIKEEDPGGIQTLIPRGRSRGNQLVSYNVFLSIPPQFATGIISASVDCIAKTGVPPDALQHLIDWTVKDNDQLKKFVYCFGRTSGFVDTMGHFIEDKMVKLVGNHPRKHQYADVLKECNKSVGKDEYDTLYKVALCFHDKTPILLTL